MTSSWPQNAHCEPRVQPDRRNSCSCPPIAHSLLHWFNTANPGQRGGFCRKPFDPFFIHSRKVGFFKKDNGGTHNALERTACSLEYGGHVLRTLYRLLLNRVPDNLSGGWIVRTNAGDEHKPSSPYRLGVRRREAGAFEVRMISLAI